MKTRCTSNFDDLTKAWQELESHVPVALRTILDEQHHHSAVIFMNTLIGEIGDHEMHPLVGLLESVAALIDEYEDRHFIVGAGP